MEKVPSQGGLGVEYGEAVMVMALFLSPVIVACALEAWSMRHAGQTSAVKEGGR